MVFEGEGRIGEYVGGYVDWQRQRHAAESAVPAGTRRETARAGERATGRASGRGDAAPGIAGESPRKLSYNEQRELTALPGRIEALEAEQSTLQTRVAHPDFYKETADAIAQTLDRIADIERELLDAYARWDALDSRS
jgi:ATP-binding cassette subfamily F protein uup